MLLAPASPAETTVVTPENGDGLVRRDADRRAVGIGVGVEIDEPRQHELAGGVDRLLGAIGRDI